MTALLSLNQNSVIEDRNAIIDIVLARYYVSYRSQSTVFLGKVKSLSYSIMSSGRDGGVNRAILETKVREDVEAMLRPYFDSIQTVVTIIDSTAQPGALDIYLMFTGVYNNVSYDTNKIWSLKDSKLVKLSALQ
jgi:hypothetical protein